MPSTGSGTGSSNKYKTVIEESRNHQRNNITRWLSLSKPRNKKKLKTMKGYMYILECADGSYYTGSTTDLELRLQQHQSGEGANHTRKRLPVRLVYYEEFDRVDEAFYREKQVQGWSRRKKQALMDNRANDLPLLSKNYTDKD